MISWEHNSHIELRTVHRKNGFQKREIMNLDIMQTQICKFNVQDTVKQRQKGKMAGAYKTRQMEICSKYRYPEEEIQKE